MKGKRALLMTAVLHIVSWHHVNSTTIINNTEVDSAEFTSAAVDMVEHPVNENKLLALLLDDHIAEIDLNPLSMTILSNGSGFVNGDLSQSKFKRPTSIVKIAPNVYAIADRDNHCIRKLTWSGSPNVTCLNGALGQCTHMGELRFLANYSDEKILYTVGEAFYKIDLKQNDAPQKVEFEAVTALLTHPFSLLGLMTSSVDHSLLLITFHDESINMLTVISYNLTGKEANVIINASNVEDGFTVEPKFVTQSGNDDSGKRKKRQFTDSTDEPSTSFPQPYSELTSFQQVGNHLIASISPGDDILYDFNLADGTFQKVEFVNSTGPGIYVKDWFLYTFHGSMFVKYSLLPSCEQRFAQRPDHLSFAWFRTAYRGCARMENNQLGDPIPLNQVQSATECQRQTCYSNCQQHCKGNPRCVAFQCHLYTHECRLSTCAMLSTEYSPELSCYRLADIAYP